MFINDFPYILSTDHKIYLKNCQFIYTDVEVGNSFMTVCRRTQKLIVSDNTCTETRPSPGEFASDEINYINNFLGLEFEGCPVSV